MSPTETTQTETGARRRLDRDAVVAVAFDLVDAEGIDALTIRRLAKELGVSPTALYWHFVDKQALLDAMADQLWADAHDRLDQRFGDDLWADLHQIFEVLVDVFRRHPALAPLAPTRVIDCEPGLALTERALDLLERAGYDDARAADAARFLLCAAVMLVTSQPGAALPDEAVRDQVMRKKRAALLTLPPQRYPHVERVADFLVDCDDESDGYYDLGIELIVAGLKAQVAD